LISYLAAFVASPLLRLRTAKVNTRNDILLGTGIRSQNHSDAPRRLWRSFVFRNSAHSFPDDKPDRFFTVIEFWMDKTSGVALDLETGVHTYQAEHEEARTHLLIHLPIEERVKTAGISGAPITQALIPGRSFESALIEE
jgi:hypothetical protein